MLMFQVAGIKANILRYMMHFIIPIDQPRALQEVELLPYELNNCIARAVSESVYP